MSTQYFHFTLGPVQGFVAQARRTRDFWAGSFILSWLAAVAMKATTAQGAIIKFPAPDQNFMAWLEGNGTTHKPTQGSIPNRFKALVPTGVKFEPKLVTDAVQTAWKALADSVWSNDLKHLNHQEAKTIWDRQIPAFWDMNWVIVADEEDSSALDRRKNWRTYAATNEGGVKCTMMEGWQELSGAKSPIKPESLKLESFWASVRGVGKKGNPFMVSSDKRDDKTKKGLTYDLNPNETLCAIAFVKRRFSRYFGDIDCTMPQGWTLKGWELSSNVPSVVYMAAVHWYEQALNHADPKELEYFYQEAVKLTDFQHDEYETRIQCLERSWGNRRWKSLDGNVFFKTMLENKNIFADQVQAKRTIQALNKVNENADLDQPSPFYAILMMDGDSLGKHMSDSDKQPLITAGLKDFTGAVKGIVERHDGFLIYAGGDDVLAILPLEDAISCAVHLRCCYTQCFADTDIPTTLSGAIEFAHIKMPLTQVLKDAHNLLDEVAKEQTGRDALAIRVWKGGGLQIEWSQPWEIALIPEKDKTYLEQLTQEFQTINEKDDQFSNKFFYKVRERFSLLSPLDKKDCELRCHDANKEQMEMATNLLAVDYINSGKTKISELKNAQERIDKAKDAIRPLLNQCVSVKRTAEKEPKDWEYNSCLKADAALLVRFLAQKGVETR